MLTVAPAAGVVALKNASYRAHGGANLFLVLAVHQLFPDVTEEIFSGLFQLGGVMLMTFFPSLPIFSIVVPLGVMQFGQRPELRQL